MITRVTKESLSWSIKAKVLSLANMASSPAPSWGEKLCCISCVGLSLAHTRGKGECIDWHPNMPACSKVTGNGCSWYFTARRRIVGRSTRAQCTWEFQDGFSWLLKFARLGTLVRLPFQNSKQLRFQPTNITIVKHPHLSHLSKLIK